MKQKILFILPTLHAGGAENYTLRFIENFKDEYNYYVLSVNTEKGSLHDKFVKAGVTIIYQSIGYFSPSKLFNFYRFLKKNKFDAICTLNGNFGGIPIMTARYAKVTKRVAFYRRSTNAFGNSSLKLFYNKLATFAVRNYATDILSNSEYALQNFHAGYYKKDNRFKVISNGVNISAYNLDIPKEEAKVGFGLDKNKYTVGHVGRYDPAKNHATIFKVVQILKQRGADIHFVLCGKDTDSDEVRLELENYGITDYVTTLGLQENVPLVLKSFDLFYFPSVTEGQPNALIEAMFSKLPVLTSNIPPILEALPLEAHQLTLTATDEKIAAEKIMEFANNTINEQDYIYNTWAKNKFDYEKNFNLFNDILRNGK
ncbi:glycosyltransferase [Flavobacterium sp. LaA7.5]|nr:glycosyltransferase [Flavobacterium salilacus subsp. altitudinum]